MFAEDPTKSPQPPTPPTPPPSRGQAVPPTVPYEMPAPPTPASPDQPVAYDQYGNPLYARPQTGQPAAGQPSVAPDGGAQPHFVHFARSMEPVQQIIPPEIAERHEDSRKRFPGLNLSPGEYVISAIQRHPFGLLKIWAIAFASMVALIVMFALAFMGSDSLLASIFGEERAMALGIVLMGVVLAMIGGGAMVATYVYNSNRFYLTNESVVQEIQTSLFSRQQQTVSLINIEDASYKQSGIVAMMLNYGTIRLSTEGDETTYKFTYVSNPKQHIAILNNAVEAFKNGRPVEVAINEIIE